MMRAMTAILGLSLAMTALGACKIVPNPEPGSQGAAAQTDDARMAAKAGEIYAAQLVPHVARKAIDLPVLTAALQGGLDAAGRAHGIRPQAEGSPWNFLVKGQGTVVGADRQSRAATMALDTTGDGQADVTIQLGPVVKGTALRDAADFIVFTDYRDQIEFAKLARALNDRAHQAIQLPEGDLTGQSFRFEGATTLRSASDPLLVVPTVLEAAP
ncbi:DUF2291 family protein [Paracoccus simplex]|uniref:DUF2291 family protein n=1 Tax=Paracoccus simplex TaxID=2086346 RepID=A0ABV7S1V7_9RHOB